VSQCGLSRGGGILYYPSRSRAFSNSGGADKHGWVAVKGEMQGTGERRKGADLSVRG